MMKFGAAAAPLCMAVMLTGCAAVASAGLYGPVQTDTALPVPDDAAETERSVRYVPYSGSGPLLARNDYGILLPYVGGSLNLPDGLEIPLYGLATQDGQTVTDPVYTGVKRYGDFLILESAAYTLDGYGESVDAYTVTAAAADGHWVLDAGDWVQWLCPEDYLAAAREDGSVLVLTADGEAAVQYTRTALEPYLGTGYVWGRRGQDAEPGAELEWAGGTLLSAGFYDETAPDYWRYACFLDMASGGLSGTAPAGWTAENGWGSLDETPEFTGYGQTDRIQDYVTGMVYYCGPRRGGTVSDLLDADGRVVLADCFTATPLQWEPFLADGLLGLVSDGTFRYVRMDTGETAFRYVLDAEAAFPYGVGAETTA